MTSPLPPSPRYPVGISDFAELRRGGYVYVDKTDFVREVLDGGAKVTLFPRPRRFGKTLNLSTLRAFVERGGADPGPLFHGTTVWDQDGGRLREHLGRYPVIALSFKDLKNRTWADAWYDLRDILRGELVRHLAIGRVDRSELDATGRVSLDRMLDPEAGPEAFRHMLPQLIGWLHEATGERAVVLIDEYDAPLHAAWEHGYWDDAIAFFRVFLASGLKDEPRLFRGVLTGILKVAKENIFSGLNNVDTYGILEPRFATRFGFTEPEVAALLHAAGLSEAMNEVRAWYDGYRFGGLRPATLYNPWSILMFLDKPTGGLRSFWNNTSSNALLHEQLVARAASVGADVATLLSGGTLERVLDDNVPLQLVSRNPDALWALLTFSGYLTPETVTPTDLGLRATLRIPNREVAAIYRTTFERFLVEAAPAPDAVDSLVAAMLTGDTEELAERLEALMVRALSFHDFGHGPVEAIYQAFIVGLLVHLDATHRVVSNREAGFGRADVLVVPRAPGAGAVLELKVVSPRETPERALERAAAQLRDRDYAAEVRAGGATEVHQYAVVFDGKRCWLERVDASPPSAQGLTEA